MPAGGGGRQLIMSILARAGVMRYLFYTCNRPVVINHWVARQNKMLPPAAQDNLGQVRKLALVLLLTASSLTPEPPAASAQELEPGLYHSSPVGVNVAAAIYTYSIGNVLFDASLPVEGADAETHTLGLSYVRTLGLFGRSGKLDLQVPLGTGTFEGYVGGVFHTREPEGLADPRLRLAVNLIGAPALKRAEFASYRQGTILGASLQIIAPLGQYDPARLINLSTNRWSFRPELGLSRAQGRWFFEVAAGAWLFTDNDEYYGGTTLSQEPLLFVKGDAIRTFKRRSWIAVNYGIASGGESSIDGAPPKGLQTNNRLGLTLAIPFGRSVFCKFTYTNGLSTSLGADFDSYGAGLQYSWGG